MNLTVNQDKIAGQWEVTRIPEQDSGTVMLPGHQKRTPGQCELTWRPVSRGRVKLPGQLFIGIR